MFGERLRRWERIFYVVILVLALFSRFTILGRRAISHDESIHTKFSWNFYAGQGFQHNPMMHGPLLFEGTALVYALFGANDFTARLFTALAGVALVMTPLLFRKWLGKPGAAAAAVMLLISPSITYYSRYIRHDVLLMLTAVLLLWTLLRYLDEGRPKYLYWLAAFFSLMYATKEASYIYTAIFGVLLFLPFAAQVIKIPWFRPKLSTVFILLLISALLLGAVFVISFLGAQVEEKNLDEAGNTRVANVSIPWWGRLAAGLAFCVGLAAVIVVSYGLGEAFMARFRLFDLLMVIGTLTLPLGSAFLIKFVAGVDMGVFYDALMSNNLGSLPVPSLVATATVLMVALLGSVLLGLWWNMEHWPTIGLIHYAIFLLLYTSLFTSGLGALSGLVGGLAYWMAQQGVARGGQPWYYYLIIMPLYDYLPLVLSMAGGVGAVIAFMKWRGQEPSDAAPSAQREQPSVEHPALFPLFLLGWTLLSWVAYTYAGEKMPWLVVHIVLPSIFMAAWGIDRFFKGFGGGLFTAAEPATDPEQEEVGGIGARLHLPPGWVLALALPVAVVGLVVFGRSLGQLRTALAPGIAEAGPTLTQIEPLGRAIGALFGTALSCAFMFWSIRRISVRRAVGIAAVVGVGLLALLTVRTMVMANFITYDLATEFLVYAHGTPDIKVALGQIEDISWRTTGTAHEVKIAYGEDGSWPLYWYMVDYPNAYFYSTTPDPESLLDSPVIFAGRAEWDVVEEIVGTDYIYFEYNYLWWPIQDYFGLNWTRIRTALSNPDMRSALWDIIWKRDYRRYAELKNPDDPFTLKTWPHRKEFRLYVREDLARETWGYRLGPSGPYTVQPKATQMPDPYLAGQRTLSLVSTATLPNAAVRDIVLASDGTLYAVDTANHRVWHLDAQGQVINSWGEFGVGPGQFNEPWGLALDDEGDVYVADTWNHRVQKFDKVGRHLLSWGTSGQVAAYDPAGNGVFFGPRDVAVDADGLVYVTDTGNKRVQVFDAEGSFVREFGGSGRGPGQMNEPVGITISDDGTVFIADTWNRRIQVLDADGLFIRQWTIPVWGSSNPEEKPFLTADAERNVYVGDPLHQRVIAFDELGAFLWALHGGDPELGLTFLSGVAVSPSGILYIADTHTSRVLGMQLP